MMVHPYVVPGEGMDMPALKAAMTRAAYYGSAGYIDPRTYTVDPWVIRAGTGVSWREALFGSIRVATWSAVAFAAVGYLGYDPLDVTPGFGHGSEGEDWKSIDTWNLLL